MSICEELYCKISWEDAAQQLILHSAPLLAGIKVSNLIVVSYSAYREITELLNGTRIKITTLSKANGKVSVLLYDEKKLCRHLAQKENLIFIRKMGYRSCELSYILALLAKRYNDYIMGRMAFPHEIGIILGYPLEDVQGYMLNSGQNSILSGYWKVYSKPERAKILFDSYDRVTENMLTRLLSGHPISMLIK